MMRHSRTEYTVTHLLLVLAAIFAVYPLVHVVITSLNFTNSGDLLANYATAWESGHFASALLSSALVAIAVVTFTITLVSLAGYAFATMRVPAARIMLAALLVGLVLPYEVTVLPLYQMFMSWGLIDTYWALILPQVALSTPLGVFWMMTFFASVPEEVLEAARLDGASRAQVLRKVLMPVSVPSVATLATLLFLYTWNEFLLAIVLVPTNGAVQTAPLALSFFAGNSRTMDPAITSAAAVLVALPIVLAYICLQRRLIRGVVDGAGR
ncbi:carbohydrate ABC transporter permease [Streptomyces shenzhenensis]|uniref:carbohydrate ABC transporter permease n=1 Tax=Streptomyces shenzhenensis TaxID=943815 RepID=UPI003D8BD2E8